MKNRNTLKFLFATALIGAFFAASAMESEQEKLGKELIRAAEKGNLDELNRLIRAGVDVNYTRKDNTTALMIASIFGDLEFVRALINANADPNIAGGFRTQTALMLAASDDKNHEIVNLLIKSNAKLDIQDDENMDALAHSRSNCANLLIDAGADMRPTVKRFSLWNIKTLIERSIEVAKKRKDEACALLWCMKQCNQDNIWDKDFGSLIAKHLVAAYFNHKEMLRETIELLWFETEKNELRNIFKERLN